jgi:hypothetical protein
VVSLLGKKWKRGAIVCGSVPFSGCDGLVPFMDRADERRDPFLCLKINVAASFNQLLRVGIFFSFSGKTLIRNLWVTWKARNVAEESTKRYGRDSLCEIYLVRKIRNSWWWYVSICQHTTSTSVYVSLCRHNIPLENVPLYNTLRTLVRSLFLHLNLTDLRYNTHTHHTHTHTHTHIVDNMSIKYMGAVALTILHVNIWVCHYVNSIKFCNCLCRERERRASRTGRDGQGRLKKKGGEDNTLTYTGQHEDVFVPLFFAVRGYWYCGQVASEGRKRRNSIIFFFRNFLRFLLEGPLWRHALFQESRENQLTHAVLASIKNMIQFMQRSRLSSLDDAERVVVEEALRLL